MCARARVCPRRSCVPPIYQHDCRSAPLGRALAAQARLQPAGDADGLPPGSLDPPPPPAQTKARPALQTRARGGRGGAVLRGADPPGWRGASLARSLTCVPRLSRRPDIRLSCPRATVSSGPAGGPSTQHRAGGMAVSWRSWLANEGVKHLCLVGWRAGHLAWVSLA